jgi:triacylglycerol esterase/lipase EstA (alpha/beta hydrolase family)
LDRIRGAFGNWADSPLDWLEESSAIFSKLSKKVLTKVMTDLGEYYSDATKRQKTQSRLIDLIHRHRNDEILLISHSMGTIVAYDVLRALGRSPNFTGVAVEHFVTMGSPLGLTAVKGNIVKDHNERLRTPSCVSRTWVNFSDPQDRVCMDSHLRDEYDRNSRRIKVQDVMVCNEYIGRNGESNEHKSYGYLRTPEVSKLVASFL